MRRSFCIALLIGLFATLCAESQAQIRAVGPQITRVDIAEAQRKVELQLDAHPPADSELPRIGAAYDAAMRLYAGNRFSESIRALNELSESLSPTPPTAQTKFLNSLKIRVGPMVSQLGHATPLRVKLSPMYAIAHAPPTQHVNAKIIVRPLDTAQPALLEQPIELETSGAAPVVSIQPPTQAPVGAYVIQLTTDVATEPDASADAKDAKTDVITQTRWYVASSSLEAFRQLNGVQLQGMFNLNPTMLQASASVIARNDLLTERPNENFPSQYWMNLLDLSRMVAAETQLLAHGDDPFAGRTGDIWRGVAIGGGIQVPMRVYAPQAAVQSNKPLPLLVALCDSGGDEGTLLDVISPGTLKRLADRYGMLVATPNTEWVMRQPTSLNNIVDALSRTYTLDPQRIYLLGHGAGADVILNGLQALTFQPKKIAVVAGSATGAVSPVPINYPDIRSYGPMETTGPAAKGRESSNTAPKSLAATRSAEVEPNYGRMLSLRMAFPDVMAWFATPSTSAPTSQP